LGPDLVPLPLPNFGLGIRTGVGSWVWGISSTCRDPDGAWAFLDFLLSPEEMRRMTDMNNAMPARRSVLERSRLYGPGGPLRLFVEELEARLEVPRPATPAYETVTTAFATATVSILEGGDVQAQLSEAARRIDAEIVRRRDYPHP
jgi:multiple sugar transport system substrate-binding protein